MTAPASSDGRRIGLVGATGVGVGAIVGGGIFVLAGVAYAESGAGATLAFALNALIAFIAAFSFAALATRFPENGGTYAFAKKVLSVRAAFAVGWVLWFAHIVTSVLYALGFGTFALLGINEVLRGLDAAAPPWVGRSLTQVLAALAILGYSASLVRRAGGGGQWANVGKVVVFAVMVLAGLVALARQPMADTQRALTPLLPGGATGLLSAMGFTFIALQGVGLIAAVAGEVKEPSRNLPRAMFFSLGIATLLYVPLVFLVAAVGFAPGESLQELARADPDGVFAAGIRRFMGTAGYWLVIVAGVLSTLSALSANLLVGSRVALAMANDRMLPSIVSRMHATRRTPVMATYATSLSTIAILFMIPNLAAAGAAASLIFLVAYVLTHWIAYLAQVRGGHVSGTFRSPLFPLLPVVGMLGSGAVAVFQAVRVPTAGGVALLWLGLGVMLYLAVFKSGAETHDESAEARNPLLTRLRGKSPLVLVPIANPEHASSLIQIANALAPSEVARVLLLSIVAPREGSEPLAGLTDAQAVVRRALETSFADGHRPVAMISAASPWEEIRRIADEHACQSLILGTGPSIVADGDGESELERLIGDVDCDIALLRADKTWQLSAAKRILVPLGGRGDEHGLRARVIGSICRNTAREVTFMSVAREDASDADVAETERWLEHLGEATAPGHCRVEVLRASDAAAGIIERAKAHDLILLGLSPAGGGKKQIGDFALRIARGVPCAAMLIGKRRRRAPFVAMG